MSVCAETIYRACYANDARSGLAAGTGEAAAALPAARRPRSIAQAQKPSPLGEYRPTDRPDDVEDRIEPGHCDLIGQSEPHRRGHPRRAHQPLHGHRSAARRLRGRRRGHWAASPQRSCAASPGTKAARWPAGPTSKPRSASRCSSASRARRGSDLPTSRPTDCCADGSPKAPASTSDNCGSRSSRTTSTTCPADSTTGHQHTTSTLNSLVGEHVTGPRCR